MNAQATNIHKDAQFEFADHPWISIFAFWTFSTVLMLLFAVVNKLTGLFNPGIGFLLMVVVVTPLAMRIPRIEPTFRERLEGIRTSKKGSTVWHMVLALISYYRTYLGAIRLTRAKPIIPLLVMGLSCWLVFAFSQALGTLAFRMAESKPLTLPFILDTFSIAEDLPPRSMSLFNSFGSVFEEIAWRGIFLSFFLSFYSKRNSILMAAFGFSGLHLLNLLGDRPAIWVAGQLVWAFVLGLWYGYSVLKTDSLIPAMVVHWLGNSFIWSITNYLQRNATPLEETLYGVIFTVGILPTILMYLWVRFLTKKWPVFCEVESNA